MKDELIKKLEESSSSTLESESQLLKTIVDYLKQNKEFFEERIMLGKFEKTKGISEEFCYPLPGIFLGRAVSVNYLLRYDETIEEPRAPIANIEDIYFIAEMNNYLLVKRSVYINAERIAISANGYEKRVGNDVSCELVKKINIQRLMDAILLYLKKENSEKIPFSHVYLKAFDEMLK